MAAEEFYVLSVFSWEDIYHVLTLECQILWAGCSKIQQNTADNASADAGQYSHWNELRIYIKPASDVLIQTSRFTSFNIYI